MFCQLQPRCLVDLSTALTPKSCVSMADGVLVGSWVPCAAVRSRHDDVVVPPTPLPDHQLLALLLLIMEALLVVQA